MGYSTSIVFRYDDYCFDSRSVDFENELLCLAYRYNIKLTIAMVPFINNLRLSVLRKNEVNRLLPYLKSGLVEVAQHGYKHKIWKNMFRLYVSGEFRGLDYYHQYYLINLGKKELVNCFEHEVVTFIPPWNEYDTSTLKALEKLNFKYISAGISERLPVFKDTIKYIPFTEGIEKWKDAINQSEEYLAETRENLIIVFLFHWYNYPINKIEECFKFVSKSDKFISRTINEIGSSSEFNVNYDKYIKNLEFRNGRSSTSFYVV